MSDAGEKAKKRLAAHEIDVLKVNEIFYSLQGETSRIGLPTVFVRLTGCPLRCGYCDTAYAFNEGVPLEIPAILEQVASLPSPLCDGYRRRTAGAEGMPGAARAACAMRAIPFRSKPAARWISAKVDPRVSRIVDIKTPASGEAEKNRWANLELLTPHDELKFVICDAADYAWAKQQLQERRLNEKCPVLFSPVAGDLQPADLADWILRDRLDVRFQLQLHKLLWREDRGR